VRPEAALSDFPEFFWERKCAVAGERTLQRSVGRFPTKSHQESSHVHPSRLAVVAILSSFAVVACGDAKTGSGFVSSPAKKAGGGNGGDDGPTLGGDPGTGQTGGPGGGGGAACATSTVGAVDVPVYLIFMFDRSGSMKFNPQPNNKWDACVAGLETFFADPNSKGLYASMQVFPYTNNECSTQTYQGPIVPATQLPDTAGIFGKALASHGPNASYGTPTLPAIKGAIAYAQSVKAGFQNGEKVAVVLVTDGDPNDCSSSPDNVGLEAAKTKQDVPLYVIGVGPDLQNLDTIARGGGTQNAIIVDTSNPSQISQDFLSAVAKVKGAQLSCEYQLPALPQGQTLDTNAVNVQYTPAGGQAQTLTFNKDCSGDGLGWHYDNPDQPQKIETCAASCDQAKSGGGKVDIVLGCATQGGVTK
jgi:hypothetical protein